MDERTSEPAGPRARSTECSRCGATADDLPLTWTCSVENGTRRYFCETCARDHIRSIESRLDSAWW
ncbi:hypothetical protein M4914_13015 [Streptomyces somaliensis DSM 40738]|uniref:Uncharacterized protein n=1 Tax=Streptomyces somaliensis (strain ATCC 33201 / DSM 40738 / JCM 12659 / KCTC 9044 / NCTC 11332 / NRRL B-12077 / IP 733) TaxID=1134445 RepID=A0AA44IEG6_STRE0|nr:hypothetical protein [Streptomyces somaliensis]MCQ0023781.1 hypothetical protein [Streptomyces somaliensis DSM 40738]NKY15308.1 hypothetical protein [Streptomyces somaliensis DSM 40738]